jgi:ribosomal protein S18 acetylase RimI-like enzyme
MDQIKKIGLNDILPLVKMYLSLSEETTKNFHPFKSSKFSLIFMFTFFSISNKIDKIIKKLYPRLFNISIIATDKNGTPMGFAYIYNLSNSKENELEINDFGIVVLEKYQSLGIGSKLIKKIIDISISYDINRINLTVLAENENAINLYKKFGFKLGKYHKKRETWDEKYYPDYDMALDLKIL